MMSAFRLPLGAYQSMSVNLERRVRGRSRWANVVFEDSVGFEHHVANLHLEDVALRDMILALDTTIDPTSRRARAFEGRLRSLPYSVVLP